MLPLLDGGGTTVLEPLCSSQLDGWFKPWSGEPVMHRLERTVSHVTSAQLSHVTMSSINAFIFTL